MENNNTTNCHKNAALTLLECYKFRLFSKQHAGRETPNSLSPQSIILIFIFEELFQIGQQN